MAAILETHYLRYAATTFKLHERKTVQMFPDCTLTVNCINVFDFLRV